MKLELAGKKGRFMYRTEEEKYRAKRALSYGLHPDGTYGADLNTLCEMSYDYIGTGDTWYMVRIGDKVCHFLSSKGIFKKPKAHIKGRSVRIDPSYPGADIYILPQIMKRSYVSNEAYFTMPENERYKYRTKLCHYKNDWQRNKIKGEMIAKLTNFRRWAKSRQAKLSEEEIKTSEKAIRDFYQKKIDATWDNDVLNPPVGKTGYSSSDILAYRTIVLDFDGHDCTDQYGQKQEMPPEWTEQLCDDFAKILIRGCDENGEIIAPILPDSVVKTGRGLQLWFTFNPVMFPARKMVESVAKALCDIYKNVGKKFAPDLELDRASSLDLSGFKRMPGSFNSAAKYKITKRNGKGNSLQTIEQMMSALSLPVYKKEDIAAFRTKLKGKEHAVTTTDEVSSKRLTSICSNKSRKNNPAIKNRAYKFIKLFIKEAEGRCESDRNVFLFMAGTIALEAGKNVVDFLKALNSSFTEPLSVREVEKTARSASSGKYHYTTLRIANTLGFTEDNLNKYDLSAKGRWITNEERAKARRKKREKKKKIIIELLSDGLSITETARKANVCRKTVRDIRKEINTKLDEKRRTLKERALTCKSSFLLMPLFSQTTDSLNRDYNNKDRVFALQRILLIS